MLRRLAYVSTGLAAWFVATGCGPWFGGVQARGDFSIEVGDLEGVNHVVLDTRNGSIEVQVEEGAGGVRVRGSKWIRDDTLEAAESRLEEILIGAEREGDATLAIRARFPYLAQYGQGGASMRVVLPRSMDLTLTTVNSSIQVRGNTGSLQATTSNGGIQIDECAGDVQALTSNGSIRLTDLRGNAICTTSNSSVVANGVVGNLEAISSNGPIRISADPPKDGQVRASTSNSYVEIAVPKSFATTLELTTSNSVVDVDLDGFTASGLSFHKTRVHAKLNGGGGHVIGRSSNGRVVFRGK